MEPRGGELVGAGSYSSGLEVVRASGLDMDTPSTPAPTTRKSVATAETPQHATIPHLRSISYYGTSTPDASIPDTPSSTPRRSSAKTTMAPNRRAAGLLATSALFRAAEAGDASQTEQALHNLAAVSAAPMNALLDAATGASLLHSACSGGNPEIVKLMLKQKADPEARNKSDATPLHFAAAKGKHKAAIALLQSTAAEVAAIAGSISMQESNSGGGGIQAADTEGTAAAAAAGGNKGASIAVNVNAMDVHGCTPLHAAAAHGHVQVIETLVARGASVNVGNVCGATPLHYATSNGQEKAARRLLRKRANVDARDSNQCTPLHIAAFYDHSKVGQLLLSAGADTAAQDTAQMTPLDTAIAGKSTDMCSLLRANCTDDKVTTDEEHRGESASSVGASSNSTNPRRLQPSESGANDDAAAISRQGQRLHPSQRTSEPEQDHEQEKEDRVEPWDAKEFPDLFDSWCVSTAQEAQDLGLAVACNKTVQVLDLGGSCFGEDGFMHLADALRANKSIRSLNLSGAVRSAAEMTALANALVANITLLSLDLSQAAAGSVGLRALGGALAENNTLQRLILDSTITSGSDMAELATGVRTNWGLLELDLSNSKFAARLGLLGTNGTKHLATCLRGNKTLQTLVLVGSLATADEAAELASAFESCVSLLSIDITKCKVGASGASKLVKALTLCPRITNVYAEDDVLVPLQKARKVFCAIQELTAEESVAINLDGCIDVTSAEPAALLFALDQNVSLESLSIQHTLLGPENTRELLNVVSRRPRLTTLNISHCFSTNEEEALDLADFLRTNTTLTCLSVRGMSFTAAAIKALATALKRNDTLTKLRVDQSADALQQFAYFNDGMGRIKSADPEDLNDLMFEAIRLGKPHKVQTLLDAGADASARDRTSGQLPHGILLSSDESVDFPLLALFRSHWEIDVNLSKLFLQNEKARTVFKRLVLSLVHEGWRSSSGDNVMHCILKACMEGLITSVHAENLCKYVQGKRPSILKQQNNAGLSPVEIATQCSRGLRVMFADSIVKMVQTWTRASLDGAPGSLLRRSLSMPLAASPDRQGSDSSFVVVARSIGDVDDFRKADRACSPVLGRPGFDDPRITSLPGTPNSTDGASSPKDFDAAIVVELRNEIAVLQEQVTCLLEANRLLSAENAEFHGSLPEDSKYTYPVAAMAAAAVGTGDVSATSKRSARRLFGSRFEERFPASLGSDSAEAKNELANPLSPSTPDGGDAGAEALAALRNPPVDMLSPLPRMAKLAESPASGLKSHPNDKQQPSQRLAEPRSKSEGGSNNDGDDADVVEDEVEAEEFVYRRTTYFLERSSGKVYQRHGDNNFVGKIIDGVLDFTAVDSDDEEWSSDGDAVTSM